jgi:hypothetical protein
MPMSCVSPKTQTGPLKKRSASGCFLLIPAILATQEAENRRIVVWSQLWANISWDPILKKPITYNKKGSRCRPWVQAPVPPKKKKKKECCVVAIRLQMDTREVHDKCTLNESEKWQRPEQLHVTVKLWNCWVELLSVAGPHCISLLYLPEFFCGFQMALILGERNIWYRLVLTIYEQKLTSKPETMLPAPFLYKVLMKSINEVILCEF